VLQHVPVRERLTSCCLVNKRLHAAALAITSLEPSWRGFAGSEERTKGLLNWLPLYGKHLTRLELNEVPRIIQQLPCPNLLELFLQQCDVQLGPADDGTGVIQCCPGLTSLDLWGCNIIDAPEGAVVDSLSSLVHLQHLDVCPSLDDPYAIGGLSTATLPSLEHLTSLSVNNLSVENLYQLTAITGLQKLFLAVDTPVGPLSCPGLVFPASLTSIYVRSNVEGGLLSLLPAGLQFLQILECGVEGPAEGPGSFLSGMSRVQQLTRLWLHMDGFAWPPPSPAYSALTASTTLVELELVDPTLPAGIWPHMFPPMRQLPDLTKLIVGSMWVVHNPLPAWGAADLSSLVSCCPNLWEGLNMLVQPGLHVSELHKLTALRRLDLVYSPGSSAASLEDSVKGLAAITQLKFLDVWLDSPDLTGASFMPLTSLTALKKLTCTGRRGFHGAPGYPLKGLVSTQQVRHQCVSTDLVVPWLFPLTCLCCAADLPFRGHVCDLYLHCQPCACRLASWQPYPGHAPALRATMQHVCRVTRQTGSGTKSRVRFHLLDACRKTNLTVLLHRLCVLPG
jgi:hypothetical protein